jgi:hypothetical protein
MHLQALSKTYLIATGRDLVVKGSAYFKSLGESR